MQEAGLPERLDAVDPPRVEARESEHRQASAEFKEQAEPKNRAPDGDESADHWISEFELRELSQPPRIFATQTKGSSAAWRFGDNFMFFLKWPKCSHLLDVHTRGKHLCKTL